MISGFAVNQVYLATGFTDMRKSINGLSLLVSEQLAHDPFSGSIFVFCNRARVSGCEETRKTGGHRRRKQTKYSGQQKRGLNKPLFAVVSECQNGRPFSRPTS